MELLTDDTESYYSSDDDDDSKENKTLVYLAFVVNSAHIYGNDATEAINILYLNKINEYNFAELRRDDLIKMMPKIGTALSLFKVVYDSNANEW